MGKAIDCAGLRVISVFGLLACVGAAQPADTQSPGSVGDLLKRTPELVAPEASPVPTPKPAATAPAGTVVTNTLTVSNFVFTGNTLFDGPTLTALIASYQNRPLTLTQLFEAADVIGKFYVSQGYLLASAVIPAQNVTKGNVTIEVIEGRIEKVDFTGLKSYSPADLAEFLPAIEGKIYQGKEFERGLRNIDELPGLTGRAVLKPGSTYGTTAIIIEAKEKRFEGQAFVDNSGRETVGERRMALQVTANNPGGVGDALSILGLRSTNDRLHYLYGSYGIPLGASGARMNFSYGYAQFDLSDAVADLKGTNRTARGDISLPLIRSANNRLVVGAAVVNTNANTDLAGLPLTETRLTILELSENFAHTWHGGAVTQITAAVGSNFKSYSSADTNAQAFRLDTDVQHFHPLPFGFQALGRLSFVYSPDQLPDTQQYALGGPSSVRGYAPSEVRGDWGYFGSLTLRRPFAVAGIIIAPRIFGDAGTVRSRAPLGSVPESSLSSAGAGVDINYQNLNAKFDYSVPLDGRVTSDGRDDGRFYGSVSFDF